MRIKHAPKLAQFPIILITNMLLCLHDSLTHSSCNAVAVNMSDCRIQNHRIKSHHKQSGIYHDSHYNNSLGHRLHTLTAVPR